MSENANERLPKATHNPLHESLLRLRDEARDMGNYPDHERIQRFCEAVKRLVNSCKN